MMILLDVHEIPNAPELLHLQGSSKGNPYKCAQGRKRATHEDIILSEVSDDGRCGMPRIHHEKVGMRRDGVVVAGLGAIDEVLAIVGIATGRELDTLNVSERGRGSAGSNRIHIE